MQALRDDPQCAREAFEAALEPSDPGLNAKLTFALPTRAARERARRPAEGRRAARAGRQRPARDGGDARSRGLRSARRAHDAISCRARKSLESYRGVIACGGFSYGDVLGAGEGWAKTILYHERARPMFAEFFARSDAFALGVCNGCQMLAALKELIPGTESWPKFLRNRSDQFEARVSLVEIVPSPSVLLAGMAGSRLPIVTAHGEGRAAFASARALADCDAKLTAMRFVTNDGAVGRALSRESERLAARHRGPVERRRPRDDHDAAPRARVPHRAAVVASRRVGRVLALAAAVRQRSRVGRLALSAVASPLSPPGDTRNVPFRSVSQFASARAVAARRQIAPSSLRRVVGTREQRRGLQRVCD